MPYIGKSPSAGVRQRYQYTATAGQTTFSGTDLGNLTLTYTDNNFVDVFQNGVLLKGGGTDYTATSGTSIVLTTGASVSDVIEIIVYDVFSVGNFFNRTDSDSRYVNVDGDTMTGEFKANGGVVFNEDSADVDFRVESNGNANMFIVDGGNDIASIGRAVNSSSTLAIQNKDDTNNNAIDVYNDNGNRTFSVQSNTSGDAQFKAFKNDGTQGFTLLGDGSVTNPLQPAFHVQHSSSQDNVANDNSVTFPTEVFDQNGDFASNAFTAPVTGKYQLQCMVRIDNLISGIAYYGITISTSNRNYQHIFQAFNSTSYQTLQVSILADMDANDTANIIYAQSGGSAHADLTGDAMRSNFSGYLVA
jgi:hypothetical protein